MDLLTPCVVLAAYAEPLLEGRRGIVFGNSLSPLAEEMVERGARSVHVCDPVPSRAAESAARNRMRQISIVPLDDADVSVREGAFDVAIVEDLSSATDASALLKQVRRALSPRGVAFVACPNPEAKRPLLPRTDGAAAELGYYELYDKVSAEFAEVRMLGQTPFVGYAIVDFAPSEDLDVELDSGFLPTGAEEPEWFVAVAGRESVALGPFNIVQLPASRVVGAGTDDAVAEELRAARAAEAKLGERLAAVEAENARLSAERRTRKAETKERADEAQAELEARNRRLVELESRAAQAEEELREATSALDTLRERAADSETLRAERESLLADRERLEKALAEARALAAAGDKDEEVARLESQLRERAEHVRKLESDAREAERLGRELVRELATREMGSLRPPSESGESPHVVALSAENARLRADLEAAQWVIQELETRLDHALRRPGGAAEAAGAGTHPDPAGPGALAGSGEAR